MTNDQIENFLMRKAKDTPQVKITFKTRKPIEGIFIESADYSFLKTKNLWRIVTESNIESYKQTKDDSLARIFNGVEFTKLS